MYALNCSVLSPKASGSVAKAGCRGPLEIDLVKWSQLRLAWISQREMAELSLPATGTGFGPKGPATVAGHPAVAVSWQTGSLEV